MANLVKMANMAKICHGFGKYQKRPLESGEYDENSENLSAMMKYANLAKKFARGLAKIKMIFGGVYFGENGKFGEQPPTSKQ